MRASRTALDCRRRGSRRTLPWSSALGQGLPVTWAASLKREDDPPSGAAGRRFADRTAAFAGLYRQHALAALLDDLAFQPETLERFLKRGFGFDVKGNVTCHRHQGTVCGKRRSGRSGKVEPNFFGRLSSTARGLAGQQCRRRHHHNKQVLSHLSRPLRVKLGPVAPRPTDVVFFHQPVKRWSGNFQVLGRLLDVLVVTPQGIGDGGALGAFAGFVQ